MRPVGHGVDSRNGRNEGLRTGAEQQVVALVHLFATTHVVLVHHFGRAGHYLHTVGGQFSLHTQHQLTHHFLLAGNDFGQVEPDVLCRNGILRRMACAVVRLGRIQQCLGWDTAFVQTDASKAVFLEKYHTHSCLSGSFGSRISRRTSADNGNLIFIHGILTF